MEKWFNIAGPCVAADHYMLPATERLPEVRQLIRRRQYFVIHAPRQSGKTTALLQFARDLNGSGAYAALYCSLEALQNETDVTSAIIKIKGILCSEMRSSHVFSGIAKEMGDLREGVKREDESASGLKDFLSAFAAKAGKPLVILFDEADCLCFDPLISFLRQLRNGYVNRENVPFPASIALVGLRNIKDWRMRIRPDGESMGQASPFNVITKVLPMRIFTREEMRTLYGQHTAATGQVFEEEALVAAFDVTRGQPYLVNAVAHCCVDEIHKGNYAESVTAADVAEAKERIIREQGSHLDSLMEKLEEARVRRVIEPVMLGETVDRDLLDDDIRYCLELGILEDERGVLKPANPIYAETIGRYLTRGTQSNVLMKLPENPWVRDGGLDMPGLMAAFQQFWRENADANTVPFGYREAYPQLVLQAFLQRVINGGGQIVREMALGAERLDLGVHFRGAVYPVEVKKASFYAKSHEKAHAQVAKYIDRLGQSEGWLVVADPDLTKPWDEKIGTEELTFDGKAIHVVRC